MQQQARIERLEALLNRIDGWLRYAETKNGALLTLSSGILALFLSHGWKDEKDFSILLFIGNTMIFIAIVILVLSFTPKLKPVQNWFSLKIRNKYTKKSDCRNVIYFADIAASSKEEYQKKLCGRFLSSEQEFTLFENDLIDQIYTNACIATNKFYVFVPAVCFLLIGSFISLLGNLCA